ncbi:uncharacterized protein PAC_03257 [Phialocephala subalpina]|uniref:DUF6536 domain-containing protein n=1 Tax=Phialocephala subalpina TaxID=576137 RepID=A0A1L7WKT6_9HELO|nr:uncharacterized protein PAC_03257 [Phialocephala subalpina]
MKSTEAVMDPQFTRLFDEWHGDADISMIDLDLENNPHHDAIPTSQEHSKAHARESFTDITPISPSEYDGASSRTLLRKGSFTTNASVNFESQETPDNKRFPRQRFNIRKLYPKTINFMRQPSNASSFDGTFAHGKPGWWKKQMLSDRSLRSMAGFTLICAVIMFVIIFSYLKDFVGRINKNTTSVGGKDGEKCSTMEARNVAVHLFINIAATMILGCSNTYQQLVTALRVGEVKWTLSNKGDSRVGTNSPWNINDKREGKLKAWLCWILLIITSIPVHFLANSVIGPSFYIGPPTTVTYSTMDPELGNGQYTWDYLMSQFDSGCWTAFRTGSYALPSSVGQLDPAYNSDVLGNSTTYKSVNVQYSANCTSFLNNTSTAIALAEGNYSTSWDMQKYFTGNCYAGTNVRCTLQDAQPKQCRENVRMQAAFILGGCLLIKAIYMIVLNFRARYQVKDHLLTLGDVIVASVLDPELKVQNECLLNSGDGYRLQVQHTCHKHCKDPAPSTHGDGIGHCQKCKKWNKVNKSADLPHPSIAIKYKRSLLSNLGSTAITQMLILMFTSLAMLGASIFLIVSMAYSASDYRRKCSRENNSGRFNNICSKSLMWNLGQTFGTWGGFSSSATLTSLTPDSLGSEFMAFAISNGAQFLYSLLYLLLIYNLTLIAMEHEWGDWEMTRKKPRCTLVQGEQFQQSYWLQLPFNVLLPLMCYAALMHWLLGQAISATETIYSDPAHGVEHSIYFVTYASYPIFASTVLMVVMTVVCWWAFTYRREGFIPQMYGSIRACCASTTELTDFSREGIIWGDLGQGEKFRHAGFTTEEQGKIIPAELYCGKG